MNHIATVQQIYEDFGHGDVPAILEKLAEDVEWETPPTSGGDAGVPWLAPRTGREGVGEFFASLGALDFRRFEPRAFLEGPAQVAVVVGLEATVKASGHTFADEEIHLWTFDDDGQVSSFRHVVDTAKHIEAARSAVAA
ncbi:MAG TPA: nuclear transport factor 2 family protein [Solirubrobacteraceae bacterium]